MARILHDNNARLVAVLRNTSPIMVLFRVNENPDRHILPACDLHAKAIEATSANPRDREAFWAAREAARKAYEAGDTRHAIDTERLRCECGKPMCFSCGGCSASCVCGRSLSET